MHFGFVPNCGAQLMCFIYFISSCVDMCKWLTVKGDTFMAQHVFKRMHIGYYGLQFS